MADTPSKKVRAFEAGPKLPGGRIDCLKLARLVFEHPFFYDQKGKHYIDVNSGWYDAVIRQAFDDRPVARIKWEYSRAIPAVTVEDLGLTGLQKILDSLVGRELLKEEKG